PTPQRQGVRSAALLRAAQANTAPIFPHPIFPLRIFSTSPQPRIGTHQMSLSTIDRTYVSAIFAALACFMANAQIALASQDVSGPTASWTVIDVVKFAVPVITGLVALIGVPLVILNMRKSAQEIKKDKLELEELEKARDKIKPKILNVSTGPLTLMAILKGSPPRTVGDAYPTGESGVHFVFDLFNGNAFDFSVSKVVVEVIAYEKLALGELTHGVGATDVKRFYRAKINPELGRYSASYLEGRPGEYPKILAKETDKFDVEITTTTEGLYSLRLHLSGGAGGEAFDFLLDGTGATDRIFR